MLLSSFLRHALQYVQLWLKISFTFKIVSPLFQNLESHHFRSWASSFYALGAGKRPNFSRDHMVCRLWFTACRRRSERACGVTVQLQKSLTSEFLVLAFERKVITIHREKRGARWELSSPFISRACAVFLRTNPKRHPRVVVRPPCSRCNISPGTVLMTDFRRWLRRYKNRSYPKMLLRMCWCYCQR